MQRFVLAFLAALLIMVAAISPTFAQEPSRETTQESAQESTREAAKEDTTDRTESISTGITLLRTMQSDPQTPRTMVFVIVDNEMPFKKVTAPQDGATETTVCNEKFCACRADNHGSCDLFKWLCVNLGGQHTEAATSEGCFF